MWYIAPEQYESTSAFDLLKAAEHGFIGFDQRLMHALVDDPARTLPDIVRFTTEQEDEEPLEPDLISIFHHLRAVEGIPYLLRVLEEHLEEVPDDLTEAFIALGAAALDPLLALYDAVGEERGGEIAFILAGLGVRDPRIREILEEYLEYDASYGAIMFSLYGDPEAIRTIERIVEQVPKDDTYLRQEMTNAIRDIKDAAERGPAPAEPFDLFELYPAEAGPCFDWLTPADRLSLLDAAVPAPVRAEAAETFITDDLQAPERARLEEAAKNDPDPNVRGRAWEALQEFANEPELRQAMLEAARNAPLPERTGATIALVMALEPEDDNEEEVLSLVEPLYEHAETRDKALEAMWKSAKQRYVKYFPKHLDDEDPKIRTQAVIGTGLLGISSEATRLIPLFEDADLRQSALFAYALCAPPELTRGRAKGFLRKIDQLAHLGPSEIEFVEGAIDQRLIIHGHEPVFGAADGESNEVEPDAPAPVAAGKGKVGRNDPCPCGSGKKYKKCCGA